MTRRPASRFWTPAGALLLLVCTAFYPVVHAGFIWDDDSMVTANTFIKAADGLRYIWFSTALPDYFPLTSSSFWLEWRLWGDKAIGYHVVNVLLHGLSTIMLWRIFVQLKIPGAWLAAALFAVHPVNVESVAWIAERKNTLSFFLGALSVLLYLRFEQTQKRSTYIAALVAFVAALLSKTSVVALPVVLLLLAAWQRGKVEKRDVVRTAPFFVAAVVFGLVTVWFQYHRAIVGNVIHDRTFLERLARAGWAISFYLRKALWPAHLSFVYPEWKSNTHTIFVWLPLVSIGALFVILWRWRHAKTKGPLFALSCFVLMLLPVLGFLKIYFQRYSLVADHWQYFALPSITALAAAALTRKQSPPQQGGVHVRWGICVGSVIVAALAVLTWRYATTFQNAETVWRNSLALNRDAWLAHNNLGLILQEQGKSDEAVLHYRRSLDIQPDQVEGYNNLGAALLSQNKPQEAMAQFQRALKVNPNVALTHYNIANVLDEQGKRTEALQEYREALRLNPRYVAAHNNVGCIFVQEGRLTEGVSHFREALRFAPDDVHSLNNLGSTLVEQSNAAEAAEHLSKAVRLKPDYADACYNLGNALLAMRRVSEAVAQYSNTLRLNPGHALAHYKLGNALLQAGQADAALKQYDAALKIQPALPEAHYQAAVILGGRNNATAAIVHLREAVRLKPDWIEALNNLAWMLATHSAPSVRNGPEALQLARRAVELSGGNNPGTMDTLGAALAEAGRYEEAVAVTEQAIKSAESNGQNQFAEQLRGRLLLYKAGKAFHENNPG